MAINTSKVVAGGVVAGIILAVIDGVTSGMLLKNRMMAEMNAFKAGWGDQMTTGNGWIGFVVIDILIGIALIWLYAAIRPRFGMGPKTASIAALFIWILGGIFNYMNVLMGITTVSTYATFAVIWLVALLVAGWVGARIYTEDVVAP